MSSNVSEGSRFEREFCKRLADEGFWALQVPKTASGQQPSDVVAIYRNYHALVDCKVVTGKKSFSFDRIEDNQRTAMSRFSERCKEDGWFAIRFEDGHVEMLKYAFVDAMEHCGFHSLPQNSRYTITLDEWIERAKRWT